MKKDYLNTYEDVFNGLVFSVERFKEKENIILYDEAIPKLRFLVSGKAKIYMIHEDGKRSIVHFVKPNEYIGELYLVGVETHPKNVVAIEPCVCLSVDMLEAKKYLLHDPQFLLKLNQYIGKKLLDRTWFNAKNLSYELKHRLAAYMLMTSCNGIYNEKHTETADYLNISYRHLLQTIKDFLDFGYIKKLKRGYEVNADMLRVLAKDIDYFG